MSKPASPKPTSPQPAHAKPAAAKPMTAGQRAYEEKRAGKAGVTLDKHLQAKERRAAEDAKKAAPPPPAKKQGRLARLIERASRPLKS